MVKAGYKQTEIGVIPESWSISKLGNIGHFKNGINKDKGKFGYGVPIIGLMDVFGVNFIDSTNNSSLVDASIYEQEDYSVREGDVFFVRSSVKPTGVGLTAVAKKDLNSAVFSGFLLRYRTKELTTDFKRYAFYASYFRENIIAASTVSANTNINQDNLKQLLIAYPDNIKEQNQIAKTLSDIDDMICSLEKLLAKKKAVKQGAMQELLTGKKRLSGFTSEWRQLKLKETGIEVLKGQIITQKEASIGKIPVVAGGKTPAYYCDKSNRTGTNITISASGASAGFVNIYREDIFASDCSTISESEEYNIYFVYNLLLNEQETIYASQTGGAQPHIHPNDIYELKVHYTFDVEEQKAIASILSDMDSEIEALEQKLAKTRELKQGMMQQLLTGKIRLV